MTYTNFTLDIDADGIALLTWDMPGRSMNVIDLKVIDDLGAIIDKVAADAAIKGVVITSGKDSVLRRRRPHDAGGHGRDFRRDGARAGRGGGRCRALRAEPQAVAALSPARDLRQAVGRGDQRHRLGGAFELALACHYRVAADNPKTRSACPRSRSGCFPAPAAPSASRA